MDNLTKINIMDFHFHKELVQFRKSYKRACCGVLAVHLNPDAVLDGFGLWKVGKVCIVKVKVKQDGRADGPLDNWKVAVVPVVGGGDFRMVEFGNVHKPVTNGCGRGRVIHADLDKPHAHYVFKLVWNLGCKRVWRIACKLFTQTAYKQLLLSVHVFFTSVVVSVRQLVVDV